MPDSIRYVLHPARPGMVRLFLHSYRTWHGMYTPAYSCVHCSASIYMYPDTQQTEFPVQSSSPELPHPFWIGINVPIPTNKKHEKKALAGIERHTESHAPFFFLKKSRETGCQLFQCHDCSSNSSPVRTSCASRTRCCAAAAPAASPSPIARPTAPDSDQ